MGISNLAKVYESSDSIKDQASKLRRLLEGNRSCHAKKPGRPFKHTHTPARLKSGKIKIEPRPALPALSKELLEPVLELLRMLEDGKTVTLYPKGKVLTTQECADIIGCSRQHVVNLCKTGKLKFDEVGSHKKIKVEDLKNYREGREVEKKTALGKMVEAGELLAEKFGDDIEME